VKIHQQEGAATWIESMSTLLIPRRIRAHALILALCLWGICAIDYATPGLFDRAGNLKFQDFLQFSISGRLIAQGRSSDLYNPQVLAEAIQRITGRSNIDLKFFYGPQVALPFILLDTLSFMTQAEFWVALSVAIYFACIYFISKPCSTVDSNWRLVVLCSIAYPPVFHFFARGQLSSAVLLFVTLAYLSFRAGHACLAGLALGCLAFKPQFLVAIPLILLLAKEWSIFAGLAVSAAAQLGFAYSYFGRPVMRAYFFTLLHSAQHPASTELKLSAIQMHSLYSFWELLIPWPIFVWIAYFLSSIIVIVLAAKIWKAPRPLSLRFSALLVATVLVNPHIYIYDLLVLAPVFLLLVDWSIQNADHPNTPALRILLYLAFLLPLFGPLARWTHLQLSVIVFAALLWTIQQVAISTRREIAS
jgi:alpha-1,2-mannosyltransferase